MRYKNMLWFNSRFRIDKHRGMYLTDGICTKCGKQLHVTNLNKRKFCKTCWEYRDKSK